MVGQMDSVGQNHHGKDIHSIVVKHAADLTGITRSHEIEVEGGNPLRWDIVATVDVQQLRLKGGQSIARVRLSPDSPGGEQKVVVGYVGQGGPHPGEDKASFQKGDIEVLPVEGYEKIVVPAHTIVKAPIP